MGMLGSLRAAEAAAARLVLLVLVGLTAGAALGRETAPLFLSSRANPPFIAPESPQHFVVLFQAGTTAAQLQQALEQRSQYVDPQPVQVFGRQHVALVTAKGDVDQARTQVAGLVGTTPIRAALRAFETAPGAPPLLETEQLCVRLKPGANLAALTQQYGLDVVRPTSPVGGPGYVLRLLHPEDVGPTEIARQIMEETTAATYAHADYIIKLKAPRVPLRRAVQSVGILPRYRTNDPLLGNEWHLENTGQFGGLPGADIHATEAWDFSRGAGAIIGVIDDSIEIAHEDLVAKIVAPFDAADGDNDPSPTLPGALEAHGTATSGCAAATGDNGIGVAGGAPDAQLIPVRLGGSFAVTMSELAGAFDWLRTNGCWVSSNSWGAAGPIPGGGVVDDAITALAALGRGGLGTPVLFSAGNGNSGYLQDSGNVDSGWPTNHPDVWPVGGSSDVDLQVEYSDTGDGLFIMAPTMDIDLAQGTIKRPGIATTDIMGADGYAPGNYTSATGFDAFNGTSASCPIAAGGVTCVLASNPTLTRDELGQILIDPANIDKIDFANGRYDSNGHSRFYGYGRLNAGKATLAAVGLLGVDTTVSVNTVNAAAGGRAVPATDPIPFQYEVRGRTLTGTVSEAQPTTVKADPGSTITIPAVKTSSSQRWVYTGFDPDNPVADITLQVGPDATVLPTVDYLHQVRRSFRAAVQSGSTALDAAHAATLDTVSLGEAVSQPVTGTAISDWTDTGSAFAFSATAAGGTAVERWVADDTNGDGDPDPFTGTINLTEPELVAQYFYQVRPTVKLTDTSQQNPATAEGRKLFRRDETVNNVYGIFDEFCDNGSQLVFSKQTTPQPGFPVREAEGVREFTVTNSLDREIKYVIQPLKERSNYVLQFRNIKFPRTTAPQDPLVPANGRTVLQVVVTINNSVGNPISGITPSRVDLNVLPSQGIRVQAPSQPSDAAGNLVFEVTSTVATATIPFEANPTQFHKVVEFGVTLDGQAIQPTGGTRQAAFVSVMSVPLPQPGLYLVTFPITPAAGDSQKLIEEFNVTPKPTLLGRWDPSKVVPTYDYFALSPGAFEIAPGRGFFLKTAASGSAELTGEWSEPATVDTEGRQGYVFDVPEAGWHQLGNPQTSAPILWRLSDFVVEQAGQRWVLDTAAAQAAVDDRVWVFNGTDYEPVVDPTQPGTEGLRSQVSVFEGFFWRVKVGQAGGRIVYTPDSGRSRRAEPISRANFGFSLAANAGGSTSVVTLGAKRQPSRSSAAPPPPDGDPPVRLEVVADGRDRASAEWVQGPLVTSASWQLSLRSGVDGPVVLSWPHLNRQLPAGYRVRLSDPTNGKTVLLNTHSSYVVAGMSRGAERSLEVTVLPRAATVLQVLRFQPSVSRGRAAGFDLELTSPADVFLRVTSLAGRLVAETAPVHLDGPGRVTWDGLDNSGRPVPRGAYQITVIARNDEGEAVRAVRTVTIR